MGIGAQSAPIPSKLGKLQEEGGAQRRIFEHPHLKGYRPYVAGSTRCVLGLRDVLDDPATIRREWGRDANEEAIRNYYDAIWVYGDPAVYDPVREYHFAPDVAASDKRYFCASLVGVGDAGLVTCSRAWR